MANSAGNPLSQTGAISPVINVPRYSESRRILRVFFGRKLAVIGLAFIILEILVAIFAPLIAPYDPIKTDLESRLLQPSREHLLGTDSAGRDLFSRVIYGARTSLIIGISAVSISTLIGMTMGICAGFFGSWVYTVIMRFTDALMTFPNLILVLLISGLVGGGMKIVIFALAVGGIAGKCRLMCAQTLTIKQNDYVLAARAMGMGNVRMLLTQILPNAFPPLLVVITMQLGTVILGEAALSFLGVGILPPTPAWGRMVNEGYRFLLTNPLLSIAPGLAIMLVVFGFNMAGDGLRDAIDPRLRGAF